MEILYHPRPDQAVGASVVCIGKFDGVHRGHQALLAHTRQRAEEGQARPLALTFDPHPQRLFHPDSEPFLLTTTPQKIGLLEAQGVGAMVLRFDQALAGLEPADFAALVLRDMARATRVIVGQGFRFGRQRSGDVATLTTLGQGLGFEVEALSLVVEHQGTPISSTRARQALAGGDLAEVEALLGRRWRVEGPVVHGDARGRQLGFPTANIALAPGLLLPPDGIWAARLWRQGHDAALPAAAYLGTRPTFEGQDRRLEAFVLDHPRPLELYDERVELEFCGHVRHDRHFEDAAALQEQMRRDVERTRTILASLG